MNALTENSHIISEVVSDEPAATSGQTAPTSHFAQSNYGENRHWRVLVVDDDALSRTLLKSLLDEHVEFQVVGEASDGEEAAELAERYRPDVILMDIHLPRINGAEATRLIIKKLPQSVTVAVSCLYTPQIYNSMMAAGAVAFVRKEDAMEVLYKTLKFAVHTYLCKSMPAGPHNSPDGITN